MICSSPFVFLTIVRLRVQCIRGGNWSNFDAGRPPQCLRAGSSTSLRDYPIYGKEMLAIMHALTKFKQYLIGSRFVVKIDHNSLKYFLD
jgi:hypothetical protein